MTLNDMMARILRYFTEFDTFRVHCIKVYVLDGVVKKINVHCLIF